MRARGLAASLLVTAFTLFLLFVDKPGRARRDSLLPPFGSISAAEVAEHLRFLSSDRLEGRAPATAGGTLAAEYLAEQLTRLGYAPAGDEGTFFQRVPVVESVIDPQTTIRIDDQPALKIPSEMVVFSDLLDQTIAVSADVVFVGHGIVAPEYEWDDYAGINVTGRIVLVMVNEPAATAAEPALFGGAELSYYGRWTYKFEEAARHGAVGVILIHTDQSATYPWQVVQSSWGGPQYSLPPATGQPALTLKAWVTDAVAREMTRRGGRDLDALRRGATVRGAMPVSLGVRVSASIVRRVEQKVSPNVIGVLEGSDPSQGVMVTAHYDHLGVRPAGASEPADADRIYNGALDNASGVAGALAIARAFSAAGARPRRSIYVMFTTAEESGLLGAEYFVQHPALPVSAFAAEVNIDELNVFGPSGDLVLLGAERSTILATARRIAARTGRAIVPDLEPGQGNFFRSDHFPLAKAGIPAVSVGLPTQFVGPDGESARARRDAFSERDYHQTSDEMRDDWNYDSAVDDLRLLGELVWTLAHDPVMPAYRADDPFARPRK
ncbi:MAG: M20/M25/M40 family metallo-hydrolase [Vicinamibacterales bacterium]